MKIGILVSMINNFGEKGFYNSQEIGLAKALVSLGDDVIVYKLLKIGAELPKNETGESLSIQYSSVRAIGINGLVETEILDTQLDGLVFFSDTQLSVPNVYKWCKKNAVVFLPYIGVTESHSPNALKAAIMNTLFTRNIKVFRKNTCFVKNADVGKRLNQMGVSRTVVAPVGIDLDLLKHNYVEYNHNELKQKYGYRKSDKVILFIGRLEEEKRPIDLIKYFSDIYVNDNTYRLLLVGKGVMYAQVVEKIEKEHLENVVQYIDKIPNEDVWELYCMCDCFVNLNRQEIFGMVLLEAMYYEAKVVAWHAPGPDYIIEDGKSGYLVNTGEEFVECVLRKNSKEVKREAHKRIVDSMTWKTTAALVNKYVAGRINS